MNRERDLAVTLANIDDWHNLPVWNKAKEGSRKDFGWFFNQAEGFLDKHYSADTGFLLSWVVRNRLYIPNWSKLTTARALSTNQRPDFFDWANVDEIGVCVFFIVPPSDNIIPSCCNTLPSFVVTGTNILLSLATSCLISP